MIRVLPGLVLFLELRAPTSLSGDLHPNPSLSLGRHIRWKWRFQREKNRKIMEKYGGLSGNPL